jgi:hypothetical protein
MKNLILLAIAFVGGYFAYHFISGSKKFPGFDSHISISEITKNPSAYTDSTLDVKAKILESTTLLNYTKSTISDNDGNKIVLIGNKPYKTGEEIDIKAHLYVLYQQHEKQCSVLVEDDFKMLKGILSLLEHQLL